MDYYFISDDSFFLSGLRGIFGSEDPWSRRCFLNAGSDEDMHEFLATRGDVVIIAVENLFLRRQLMVYPVLCWCRLLLLSDIPVSVSRSLRVTFPVILTKRSPQNDLISYILAAAQIDICHRHITAEKQILFRGLSVGISVARMADICGKSLKYIYQLCRKTRHEYQMDDCNAAGILMCQEILTMKIQNHSCTKNASGGERNAFFCKPVQNIENDLLIRIQDMPYFQGEII